MNRYSKTWAQHIPSGGINAVFAEWHNQVPDREQTTASPSTLLDCPRYVWLKYRHHVPATNDMGWGKRQRMLLGRTFENKIAEQLQVTGHLLWHWKDDTAGESVKFTMGKDKMRLEGTPDLLIKMDDAVLISDSKTSRSDGFAYVPTQAPEIWEDFFWYKYKLQVTAYYLLAHTNQDWFTEHELPLPTKCHLFSYALDNGIVHREITWEPTQADALEVARLTKRWNEAFQSETMPDCTCHEYDGAAIKFCQYGDPNTMETTKKGYKLMTTCCSETLIKEVKV